MKALRADLLYTGKPGEVLRNVYVLFEGEKIIGVSEEKPREGEIIDFDGSIVTPAFIDSHCHIGMNRHGEPSAESESNEKYGPVLPLIDAIYSVYLDDKAFKESIEHGVLYSCILPGSGNIIGGKGVLIRNYGRDVEEAFIKYAGVKAALGYNPRSTVDWKGVRPYTRMGAIAILRRWLEKAKDQLKLVERGKKTLEEVDPEIKHLFPVVKGEERLRVHVHKMDDAAGLLMIKREFNLKVTAEHLGDVHSKFTFEKLKKENIPIIYGPLDSHAYKVELKHRSWRNAKLIVEVKPLFSIMSDHPVTLQRNIFLQTRFFRRFGMSKDECIALLTSKAARILEIDDKLGTIENGKWASMIVWSGDPFSLDSYPKMVIGEGKILHEES
ncbi:MAG: amidohydrolase [archaeon GB-1867-097]|nr:amidohydrolase [Candidatus Verstraetearchaeota archaeon]MCS7374426.1 amidohydrolase [Candidatus Culexmicrobium thermophilum]MCS7384758.1 amidohydrolase [Candidatus Culexmicrobium thermophilum]RLE57117.1 MAG: imidazolonepropionase [Candidatus Verstraetearchaeota archaeon]HDO20239.1 imidazolonepropionase [Candidatus Bathyarchaeota archaeon]